MVHGGQAQGGKVHEVEAGGREPGCDWSTEQGCKLKEQGSRSQVIRGVVPLEAMLRASIS